MPTFVIIFLIVILANKVIPFTLNLLDEQFSLIGILEKNPISAIFWATSIVLSACYSIF
jgi:NADH:ubiquinone oxidoreductase subunit 4 (subunit M)